jgi:N-methylhydantoinase A
MHKMAIIDGQTRGTRAVGRLHAAVDVGGTFIDLVVADIETGQTSIAKVLHRHDSEGEDIVGAIDGLTRALGCQPSDLDTIVIGTTVVTNALLQGQLAKTALLTTQGFRDVIEIARMSRPSSYNLHRRRPPPLVPRHLRLEVEERLAHDGSILIKFSEESATKHIEKLRRDGIEAVAVCLLFSFVDPTHERKVRDLLASRIAAPISLSSEVLPVFREFERCSTTIINAATTPIIRQFVDALSPLLSNETHAYIMGSDGGCLTLREAARLPARCTLSGPAGVVMGALNLAVRHKLGDVLTLDVGGTSTDVAMLRGASVPLTEERTIGGYPIALPSVEVETVGAGGGSIAYLDPTGLLKVGPRSAGAEPGPACYCRGGKSPTVTDAHVALQRLGVRTMLGGDFAVNRDSALHVISREIARPLNCSWVRAAQGILEVTNANIVRAVRSISVERGHDPRRLTLIAFGGAGPLHALDVARALEIPRVVVPQFPGVWSAFGILAADIQYVTSRTWFRLWSEIEPQALADVFDAMTTEVVERAKSDGLPIEQIRLEREIDLRYRGQSHSLAVPIVELTPAGLRKAEVSYHFEHERRYGHSAVGSAIELVNVRVGLKCPRTPVEVDKIRTRQKGEPREYRPVWFESEDSVSCPVYRRDELSPQQTLEGPAVVEQYDSTIVLRPGDAARSIDATGTLLIQLQQMTEAVTAAMEEVSDEQSPVEVPAVPNSSEHDARAPSGDRGRPITATASDAARRS